MYGVGTARSQARMFGLASGLTDTETLVKGMTASITNRITQQMQLRQTVQWKIDAYRSASTAMIDFSNKFLTYASKTNMLTPSFFNASTTSAVGANGSGMTVTGKPTNANLSITGFSAAKTAASAGEQGVSGSKIVTGAIDFSFTGKEVNNLAGQSINLSYNGALYTLKFDAGFNGTDNSAVADAFMAAAANIEIEPGVMLSSMIDMSVSGDELVLSSSGAELKISGGSGKALSILGLKTGDATTDGGDPIKGAVNASEIVSFIKSSDASGKTLTFNYNGITRDVIIGDTAYSSTNTDQENKDNFVKAVQEGIDAAFGARRIEVKLDSDDKLTFETKIGSAPDKTSTLTLTGGSAGMFGNGGVLNTAAGLSNRLNMSQSLETISFGRTLVSESGTYEITVNGKDFLFDESRSLSSIIDEINNSGAGVKIEYLATTDRFSITATESGVFGAVGIEDKAGGGNLAAVLFGTAFSVTNGEDATLSVSYDGGKTSTVLTRSSNYFAIDGLEITLKAGAEFKAEDGAVTFTTAANTDAIYGGIMEMVGLYNSLIDLVNKELTTKPDRNYYPLTSEMKAEMKDREVEQWEEKANSGLLFGDPTFRSIAADLRFIFSIDVPGLSRMSEYGITTGSSYLDNGRITIDEEKLKRAIEDRPEEVAQLFTMPKSTETGATGMDAGIMYRIKDVMDKYSATTGAHRGTLVNIAGVEGSYYEKESRLFRQLDDIEKRLASLTAKKKTEEDRYYRQFTSLEKYIAQMSSQSSWLFSQT